MRSVEPPGRGRPRTFDTEEIIDRSMRVFWAKGYASTTIRTLESELGLRQSSLYNAFGTKDQLFTKALDHYQSLLDATVLSHLDQEGAGRDAIIAFFNALLGWVGDADHPGCLVLDSSGQHHDAATRVTAYRQRLRALFRSAVATFTDEPGLVESRAELLVVGVFGLNISARAGAEGSELSTLCRALIDQVEAW